MSSSSMRRVLMVAFHYPPFVGSSGIQRTLKFSQYLPDYGWQPIVLTARPRAYPQAGAMRPPDHVIVHRAFALDTARHLSIAGQYPRSLALPDRWVSWWPHAVVEGLRLVRKYRPDVLWSTFPIATAHLIGATLQRLTGLPWIADFRDPMTEKDPQTGIEYPTDPHVRKANGRIERIAIARCAHAVFTTAGTAAMYAERYPATPRSRWTVIPNGFDEEDFIAAEQASAHREPRRSGPIVLIHSGLLYPDARDPRAFFAALGELKRAGRVTPQSLKVVLRASGHEDEYRPYLAQHGIEDIVFLEPAIPYGEALAEMLGADGLLIFQAANCNWQIPAKAYECMRAGRPILALVDPAGDTGQLLQSEGIDTIAALHDKEAISRAIVDFMARVQNGQAPIVDPRRLPKHSREARTREFADILDAHAQRGPAPRDACGQAPAQ